MCIDLSLELMADESDDEVVSIFASISASASTHATPVKTFDPSHLTPGPELTGREHSMIPDSHRVHSQRHTPGPTDVHTIHCGTTKHQRAPVFIDRDFPVSPMEISI